MHTSICLSDDIESVWGFFISISHMLVFNI